MKLQCLTIDVGDSAATCILEVTPDVDPSVKLNDVYPVTLTFNFHHEKIKRKKSQNMPIRPTFEFSSEECLTLSGSSAYRAEDRREEDRERDRSPLRTEERRDSSRYGQSDTGKQKLTFGFGKKSAASDQKKGIQIKLGASSKPVTKTAAPKPTVASVFNTDEDDEPEEMPAEARMRMRNIGRETPTSAGPNSFGKTKQGFCDSKKIFEKTLKKAMEEANK